MKRYLLFVLTMLCAVTGVWADEVLYPYNFGTNSKVEYDSTNGILTVTIGTTGDFAAFVDLITSGAVDANKTGNLQIVCTSGATISNTEVTSLKTAKNDNGFTMLDLTGAAFDADATITSLMGNGVCYVSLPTNKSISDVSLPATSNYGLKAVITSDATNATYTAYGGENWVSSYPILTNSTLNSIGNWTITNGASFTSGITVAAGALNGPGQLNAILSNTTASTLSVTMDISELGNNYTISPSSSSITALTISGLKYSSSVSWAGLTIDGSGATALTSLTMDDCTANSLIVKDFAELTAADLKGVTKAASGSALAVTFDNDPKLTTVKLYRSSAYTTYTADGTTPRSGVTVTWESPAIPLEYDGCKVTVNLAHRGTSTMSELISTARTTLGSTGICTLIVTGELSTADLESLDDANTATRIDLSEATLASGASVNSIQVPTTLLSLVLPPGNTVSSTLATTLSSATNFEYVYSNTSDGGATVPTYVWIAKTGVMPQVFANESSLISCVYLKVSAKSGIALESTSVDLNGKGLNNLQYLDVSESGLTTAAAPYYKAPHWNPYRIILPNNWSGDDMAIFAANSNVGSIAAVYSYHGTTLKIMEIVDASYSPAALADPRIMHSGTTEVDVISGYYGGNTYAQFGTNLLAALNNMGKSSFSVTTNVNNSQVVTNYTNTIGQSVKTIAIMTGTYAPNTLTFDNPSVETLTIENLLQSYAALNVDGCTSLTSLDISGSTIASVDASTTRLTSADLSATIISGAADFSGAKSLATFTSTDETRFGGNLNLSQTALTSFTTAAHIGGDISFNGASSLASINVASADFTMSSSKIHIDKSTTEADGNTEIIDALKQSGVKTIKVPAGFGASTRIHPYTEAGLFIGEASAVVPAYTITNTDMTFHDKETTGATPDKYRYWYQGDNDSRKMLTLGTSAEKSLATVLTENSEFLAFGTTTYSKVKVVGPITSADVSSLTSINTIALDLSEATFDATALTALKNAFKNTSSLAVHSNVKFINLPGTCTRDDMLNAETLAGLANSVYCVMAVEDASNGKNLTSYSFQSGSLQPAVTIFENSSAQSWTSFSKNVYTSSVSTFKNLKISGLINSYDLAGPVQNGAQLDADGHLDWDVDVVESTSQTRTLDGAYTVFGPFCASFQLTEIDLRDAYFEEKGNNLGLKEQYKRYWTSDMTLSALNVISTATYKVVIPQDKRVHEIPADFMNCSTNIRAICIPSNIQAIRTRAFWTIDYVWTTSDAFATSGSTSDPEGQFTRLDNGAKLNDGTQVNALVYNTSTNKYEENPAFHNSYYTANYSGFNGGGSYTLGSSIKLIETGAFANTEPNVKDVYVLNTTAPECHVDAFNTVMYTGNGGYNSAAVTGQGIITREAYFNSRWITMLHYPRQTTDPNIQRYTDPTRNYSIATGERDGKGSPLYFPNQSEFIRAYQQGTYGYTWNAWDPTRTYGSVNNGELTNTTVGWSAANQGVANNLYSSYTTGGSNHKYYSFYDTSLGGNTKPSDLVDYYNVNWSGSAYSTVSPQANLYPKAEASDDDDSGEKTSKDYRGWHQFVLNAYAANTVLQEEPYRSYITDDDWWTLCPTFDITRNQAIELFGSSSEAIPYVSRLLYVRREYDTKRIYLNFSDNLMVYKENRVNATDKHGKENASTGIVEISANTPGNDDVVMKAGVPYLIKPNIVGGSIRQFLIFVSPEELAKVTNQDAGHYRYIADNNLYQKIKDAQAMSGTDQIALVQNGLYSVPVFVSGSSITEGHDGTSYSIPEASSSKTYNKSTAWKYTFVGSFYLSPIPRYGYFLGKSSAESAAQFFYNNYTPYSSDNFRWANETGIICPTKTSNALAFTVTQATDMQHPAHWSITTQLDDDSFDSAASRSYYNIVFGSGDMEDDATGISDRKTAEPVTTKVYSVNGQQKGSSLNGLAKGVYIMNGKKYVVK